MIAHIFANIDVFLLGNVLGVAGTLIALYFIRKRHPDI